MGVPDFPAGCLSDMLEQSFSSVDRQGRSGQSAQNGRNGSKSRAPNVNRRYNQNPKFADKKQGGLSHAAGVGANGDTRILSNKARRGALVKKAILWLAGSGRGESRDQYAD